MVASDQPCALAAVGRVIEPLYTIQRGADWDTVPVWVMQKKEETPYPRGVFRPRQIRQLPRAVDLKGRLLSCQSY